MLRDPDRLMLRRGLRTAITVPLAYYLLANILGMPDGATQACYAAFSQSAMADFTGSARQRAGAYGLTAITGLGLVVVGSAASPVVALAVAITAVVALTVNVAALLRGNFGRAVPALLMPLVLSVTSGPASADMRPQLVGFAIGSLLSGIAALTILPIDSRARSRATLASAIRQAASRVRGKWLSDGTVKQPGGAPGVAPGPRQVPDQFIQLPEATNVEGRALIVVADELQFLNQLVDSADLTRAPDAADQELASVAASTLDSAAQRLVGSGRSSVPNDLDRARADHLSYLDSLPTGRRAPSAAGLTDDPPDELIERFRLRAVALSTEVLASYVNTVIERPGAGHYIPSFAGSPFPALQSRTSVHRRLFAEVLSGGPWLRNAIRSAIAIAAATLIAMVTDVSHGYWVVLGTLVALRFSGQGTRRNARQMIIGTSAGFVLGCVIILVASHNQFALWTVFVATCFLAAYAPQVIGLWMGQASFTVLSVALFAISTPGSFLAAGFRALDVGIAIAISLLVSATIWPRGVVRLIDARMIAAARCCGARLVAVVSAAVGVPLPQVGAAAGSLEAASDAYELASNQAVPGLIPAPDWALAITTLSAVNHAADLINTLTRELGSLPMDADASRQLRAQATRIAELLPMLIAESLTVDHALRRDSGPGISLGWMPMELPVSLIERQPSGTEAPLRTAPIWLAERLLFINQVVARFAVVSRTG